MHLIVTVEKRQARLIGHKVHGYTPETGHHHGIFCNAASRLSVYFHYLEKMPVDVQRMVVIRAISKEDAIFRARPKHEFVFVRKFLAVNGPVVEAVHSAGDLFENHVDHFRGRGWRSRQHRGTDW